MIPDLANRLSNMDEAWKEAPAEGGYELPPDGVYQALVERFDWFEAQTNGHLFLKSEMRISGGQYEGAPASTVHDVEDPNRLGWVKSHLKVLGLVDVEPFSTLEQRLQEIIGVPVEIRIKTSEKRDADGVAYRNVYVNKRLGGQQALPSSNDDIPF